VVKEAVGPGAAFTPWNFPINRVVRKLDGPEAGTGPMANPRRITAMEIFIGDATQRGATVQTGGHRIGNNGNFFEPTVLTDVPKDARVMNEEPFGPLAVISPFSTFAEVVTEANRLPYGLASCAYTRSAKTANATAVESGMISTNRRGAWKRSRTTELPSSSPRPGYRAGGSEP
jgi:acyl-CoA reductase-like NAD-dependent aldehyde dehydrogenase